MDDSLCTAEEIARLLKVSKQFVYNLSNPHIPMSRRLPSVKIGRLRRFRYKDVLEYFTDRESEKDISGG